MADTIIERDYFGSTFVLGFMCGFVFFLVVSVVIIGAMMATGGV